MVIRRRRTKTPKTNLTSQKWRKAVEKELRIRDNGICHLCGLPLLNKRTEIDHIVWKADGGADWMSNLRLGHYDCHHRRHDLLTK